MLLSRNNKGQTSKQLSILFTKEMKEIAKDCERRVKIEIREELDRQHKADIYNSLRPTHTTGIAVQKYNQTHKHQKKHPYHHTGTLVSNVHAEIVGDVVRIEVDDVTYPDGTSVRDVYKWLDKGTKQTSDYDYYILGGKGSHTPYVEYVDTPKHNFVAATRKHMDGYISNTIIPNIRKRTIHT